MAVLTTQQRNTLESAVKQARKMAEIGAFNALHSFAVDYFEPFAHMTPEQRALRNRLRSKARLLGDELAATGNQHIEKLTYELAYENWHKMLFAKFLESNGLLMHPSGVAVTMEECEELAKDEGFTDKWESAATYASKMLPAIFRPEDPLMQVNFASNDRIKLEEIIDSLDNYIFTADDALGWVYQFWQSEAKAAINASGDKIDGAKLPAVTQLFTEPYMVHFLIDNTIGAWWVSRNPGVSPPVKFDYLRLLDDGTPAAGKFEGWPEKTFEITSLDPCMGSGHFVASLFTVFASLRMHEENLTKEQATDRVITENLHGLEIDPRCTQIAAFNLALTAWKFCGHYKELPEMNLACSGIAPKGKVEDWVKLVGKTNRFEDKERMENGMRMLYDHFQLAPELGSLLDPSTIQGGIYTVSFEELQPVLVKALEGEVDKDLIERGVMAAGIAKAGEILAQKYTLQITNVPYLSKRKMEKIMGDYCDKKYPEASGDLSTVFLERMLKSNSPYGITCSVIPQNWLFLTSSKKFREKLLKNNNWSVVARLGAKSFQTPMWDFNVMLISIQNQKPNTSQYISGFDVSLEQNASAKDEALKIAIVKTVNQLQQLKNPESKIVFTNENLAEENLLSNFVFAPQGIITGDADKWRRYFWEVMPICEGWIGFQSVVKTDTHFGGNSDAIDWRTNGLGMVRPRPDCYAFGRIGVVVSQMNSLPASLFFGDKFDGNVAPLIPKDLKDLPALWSFVSSSDFKILVRALDQKLNVTNGSFLNVPFDLEYWRKIANEKYPNGLPKPYTNDSTQWIFHGHPVKADNPLQTAVARLLCYRWPGESAKEMELSDEARELIKAVKTYDHLSDDDGIFCIPAVNTEDAGADRLRSFLQKVYGEEWNNQTLSQLLTKEGASSSNLEDWLRKEFFIQHCKVFQNRPFIWHIWDGRNDGFSALVNYHMLNKDNLSKLIYTYLGDWIRGCEAKRKSGESGAEGLLSAALKLKEKLEAILQGDPPYDIFVRWKSLAEQPIGWEPDLNDGVRLNIRPFIEADLLRKKPNIKWGVDRGKNPPGSYWGEVRDNDRHLTLEEKRIERAKI